MGGLLQDIRRIVRETNEPLRGFELLVFVAETFELEPEHIARSARELAAELGTDRASGEPSQSPADNRQSLLGNRLQSRTEERSGLLSKAREPAHQAAEKLLEFRLVSDRQQFGGHLHFPGLGLVELLGLGLVGLALGLVGLALGLVELLALGLVELLALGLVELLALGLVGLALVEHLGFRFTFPLGLVELGFKLLVTGLLLAEPYPGLELGPVDVVHD